MKDVIARIRKKARIIAEVRYPVVPQFLDMRGKIIGELNSAIKDPFDWWSSNPAQVLFLDRQEKPRAEFVMTPKQTAVILEDVTHVPEFLDRAEKYLRLSHELLGQWITTLSRVGVRFIEVLEVEGLTQFDPVLQHVLGKMHQLPQVEVRHTDALVRLVHEQGYYQVGPVKRGEEWVKQSFKVPEENVPNAGVGLDIDSFAKDVKISDADGLISAVLTVAGLTTSVEEALARYLGLIHD